MLETRSGEYSRARYYDPQIGRFISEDPVRYLGFSDDFYTYAVNAPTSLADPSGMTPATAAARAVASSARPALQLIQGGGGRGAASWLGKVLPFLEYAPALAGKFYSDEELDRQDEIAEDVLDFLHVKHNEKKKKKPCKDGQRDCDFAGDERLNEILQQAGAKDAHEFKGWYVGKGAPLKLWDICTCKDGAVVIKAVGQCGKPGPEIDTGHKWK